MTQTTVPALVIRRIISASPEAVYAAWTTPQTAQQFLVPGTVRKCEVEMDVRTGGRYRLGMHREEGDVWYAKGVYREVAPPRRLMMTWTWEEDDPAQERETLLTLDFNPVAEGTELTLTHEYLADEASRSNHGDGWGSALDKLEKLLSARG